MSISKKGSRRIVVDGNSYLWMVRGRPTYCQGAFASNATAAMQLEATQGSILLVELPQPRCDNWLEQESRSITPKLIEQYIREAIVNGWAPAKNGSAFHYKPEPIEDNFYEQ